MNTMIGSVLTKLGWIIVGMMSISLLCGSASVGWYVGKLILGNALLSFFGS